MSALPDNPHTPAGSATHDAGPEEPRHLHAVPLIEATAEPEPPTSTVEPGVPTRSRALVTETVTWLRTAFVPDSGLYTDRQPSIAETMRRAKHGGQLSAVGPLRTASTVHGYGAAANKAVALTWMWIVDHPARLGVVTVLVVLAIVYPPTRHVLGVLLTPAVWAQQALT